MKSKKENTKTFTTIFLLTLVLLFGGSYLFYSSNTQNKDEKIDKKIYENALVPIKAIVYKSPNCGCCVAYARELEKIGIEVQIVNSDNMTYVKNKYSIPQNKQSCHTIALGSYFIEGHVPMEAVKKLAQEKPDIEGIGLPGMPSGSPGMPGIKRAPFEVYQAKDGNFTNFMVL